MMHYNSYLSMSLYTHLVHIVFKSVLMLVIAWYTLTIFWIPLSFIYRTIFIINTCNILMITVSAYLYSKTPS